MSRLAQLATSQAELQSKVFGSLVYPVFLLFTGGVVLGVIFGVFVPKFREVFDRVQGGLPWVTSAVLAISRLVSDYGLYTLGAVVILGIAGWRVLRKQNVRVKLARWWTFAPVAGPLIRSLASARFCRMLGTMLAGNGVPLLSAMNIAREAAGNPVVEEAIVTAGEAVGGQEPGAAIRGVRDVRPGRGGNDLGRGIGEQSGPRAPEDCRHDRGAGWTGCWRAC